MLRHSNLCGRIAGIPSTASTPLSWMLGKFWTWKVLPWVAVLLYGLGVTAMYGNDFIIAAMLYFVAVVLITARLYSEREVKENPHKGGIRIAALTLAALLLGVSLLWIKHRGSQNTSLATTQAPTPPAPTDSPHVQALLIIDSVTSQSVCYHFHLENIGKILVRDIRLSFSNERVTDVENMIPIERTLPAGGKMEVSGPPLALLPYKDSRVVAVISYSAEGSTDRFASTYRFLANPNEEKTIAPEGWLEQRGIARGLSGADVLAKTESSQGTLFMVVPESRPDGKPNVVILRDSRKYLRFDPVSHTADYNLLLNSGRLLSFKLPFKDRRGHVIGFTWDYKKGGLLDVDGVTEDKTNSPNTVMAK